MNKASDSKTSFHFQGVSLTIDEHSSGLSDVPGFRVAGVHCDVRNKNDGRLDLALIVSDVPCPAAAVFTTNDVKAAPVLVSKQHLESASLHRGIVANSGNANACTGPLGMDIARAMTREASKAIPAASAHQFLVCSTGRIGRQMPSERIVNGIHRAAQSLGTTPAHGIAAAEAILTSDTRRKAVTVRFPIGTQTLTVSGIAKGAGMIEPNMATMLAFIATDAVLSKEALQKALKKAIAHSFNAVTVDGDMSTNDTVIALANGVSGVCVDETSAHAGLFQAALEKVCHILARKIAGDGERITRTVTVEITGARSGHEAESIARSIGNSLLVKSSWFGGDPNWGRLLCAAGMARTGLDESLISLHYEDCPVVVKGRVFEDNLPVWKEIAGRRHFTIRMDIGLGDAAFTLESTDLSTGYVDFNKSE